MPSPQLGDPPRVVLMGVSGCGKSSVGAGLMARTGVPYLDGDDVHPARNVALMRQGIALTDEDRAPWLAACGAALAQARGGLILGCSALRRIYRDRLRAGAGGPLVFVHLAGSRDVIAARMRARAGHYMPVSLLDSQFRTLEPPGADENAVHIDIDRPLGAIIADIMAALWPGTGPKRG